MIQPMHYRAASRDARLHRLGPGDVAAHNVLSCSKRDLDEVRERLRACFREIRAIIAVSQPNEVAGLMQVQLFPWDNPQTGAVPGVMGTEDLGHPRGVVPRDVLAPRKYC